MFRLVLLTTLAACAPLAGESIDPLAGDRDLDRADLLGTEVSLGYGLELGDEVATNDEQLFVQVEGGCGRIAIFDKELVDQGVLEPSSWIECPAHLTDSRRFHASLQVRDDLLAAGPFLYRRNATGWQYEAEIGGGTPVQGGETVLLGQGQAGTLFNNTLYVFEETAPGSWTNRQRIANASSWDLRYASEDLLLVVDYSDRHLLARDADGEWSDVGGYALNSLHRGKAVSASGAVRIWDGEALGYDGLGGDFSDDPVWSRRLFNDPTMQAVMFGDERVTLLTDEYTKVFDLDGQLLAMNDEQPLNANWHRSSLGDVSFARFGGDRVYWTHLEEPVLEPIEPDTSFSQTHFFVLEAGEEVNFEVYVPEDIETIDIRMAGTGDADLYVSVDRLPTTADADCAPFASGSEEHCAFPDDSMFGWSSWNQESTFQVMVRGFEPLSEVAVVVEAVDRQED